MDIPLSEFEFLPLDVLFTILETFQPKDLVNLCRLSKRFNLLICQSDPRGIWRKRYQNEISDTIPTDYLSKYKEIIGFLKGKTKNQSLEYLIKNGYEKLAFEFANKIQKGSYSHLYTITLAALHNQPKILFTILDNNTTYDDINTAAQNAARGRHTELLDQILLYAKKKNIVIDYDTLLGYVAQGGDFDSFERFINDESIIDRLDINKTLRRAATGKNLNIIKRLIELGATYIPQAAIQAATKGNISVVQYFIENYPELIDTGDIVYYLKQYIKSYPEANQVSEYIKFLEANPQFVFQV